MMKKFKEDDWCDLTKECANQIIGYAKNLLNDAKGDDEYKLRDSGIFRKS